MEKIVVSATMEQAGHNVILIRDDIASRIGALKAQPGSDILLYCGPRLVSTLTALGLIDEYMLYVNPLVVGQGTHLFGDVKGVLKLALLKTKLFGSGVVLKYYETAEKTHREGSTRCDATLWTTSRRWAGETFRCFRPALPEADTRS